MATKKEIEVTIFGFEYDGLSDMRGLPEKAHYLVMTSGLAENGHRTLKGEKQAYKELLDTIGEDIGDRVVPKSNIPKLLSLHDRLIAARGLASYRQSFC